MLLCTHTQARVHRHSPSLRHPPMQTLKLPPWCRHGHGSRVHRNTHVRYMHTFAHVCRGDLWVKWCTVHSHTQACTQTCLSTCTCPCTPLCTLWPPCSRTACPRPGPVCRACVSGPPAQTGWHREPSVGCRLGHPWVTACDSRSRAVTEDGRLQGRAGPSWGHGCVSGGPPSPPAWPSLGETGPRPPRPPRAATPRQQRAPRPQIWVSKPLSPWTGTGNL